MWRTTQEGNFLFLFVDFTLSLYLLLLLFNFIPFVSLNQTSQFRQKSILRIIDTSGSKCISINKISISVCRSYEVETIFFIYEYIFAITSHLLLKKPHEIFSYYHIDELFFPKFLSIVDQNDCIKWDQIKGFLYEVMTLLLFKKITRWCKIFNIMLL